MPKLELLYASSPLMDKGILSGRRVFVTGAGRGIGRAIARRFCEEGARVALSDINGKDVTDAAGTLRDEGYVVTSSVVDVTDERAVEEGMALASEALEGLDTIVANAGILTLNPISEITMEEFERTIRVNLTGAFLTAKHGAHHLRRNGGGVLLCTASQAGLRGWPEMASYCSSKFGVVGLVQALAQELAPEIRVCAVAPGVTETVMQEALVQERSRIWSVSSDEVLSHFDRSIPFGRAATVEEVANTFVYLASPLASYISGVTLAVDGAELSG
ncbi:MAG: SDR family NAD(P)-dependent oxidoreductase [Actinomycetota bacterium]